MAIAKFQMPDGRVARFEVPDGMSPEEAQAQFEAMLQSQQLGAQPSPVERDQGISAQDIAMRALRAASPIPIPTGEAEALATIGSGIVAEPLAGIAGVAQTVNPFAEPGAGAEAVQATREALTYQPRTEEGVSALGAAAGAIEPVAKAFGAAEEYLGEKALEETESPLAATIAHTLPTAIMEALGVGAIKGGVKAAPAIQRSAARAKEVIEPFVERMAKQGAAKQKIAEQIAKNPSDSAVVKYMVDGAERVKKDPIAIEAIKQGYDEGVVAAIKGATPRDRAKMKVMMDILKKGKRDATFRARNRATDVVGDSLVERVSHIMDVNRKAGSDVNKAAKSLKGKPVDFTDSVDSFMGVLDDMGIQLDTVKGKIVPMFKGSDIEGIKGAEQAVKRIISRMENVDSIDAYELHRLKKYIDENVSYGKQVQGLTGKTERALKSLRTSLDEALDNAFPEYKAANDMYSQTIGVLDDIQGAAGKSVDLSNKRAAGTSLRRILSNTQSRANMIDAIDNIDKISKKTGGKFVDDITAQMIFADELESMFGPTARTSLAGETKKSIESVARSRGFTERAVDLAASAAEKARGINEENAIKVMEKLLTRGSK